jgi:hypothetical protein
MKEVKMQVQPLEQVRSLCLALPEACESSEGVGDPAFKVRAKIFAMQHRMGERMSLWCKAQPGAQGVLVEGAPERFFVPPYVGRYGWVGLWLDVALDWDEIAELIEESYRLVAPKRLRVQLDQRRSDAGARAGED